MKCVALSEIVPSPNTTDEAQLALRAERRRQRAEGYWLEAGVPMRLARCTLETYPVSAGTAAALARIRYWYDGPGEDGDTAAWAAWRADVRDSLLLHGPYGTGKTGLAVALLHRLIEDRGDPGLFITVPDLLDAIRDSYHGQAEKEQRDLLKRVKTVPVLVLDDIGAERVTDWALERLFVVINARHSDDDLLTIFTSNFSPAELAEHLGERIAWRIVEMCELVHLNGPNLRDRKAR